MTSNPNEPTTPAARLTLRPLAERTNEAIYELQCELQRARKKFPDNQLMLAALMEEVGELANAIIEGKDWQAEALQVACVAIRIVTEGDSTHGLEVGDGIY